MIVPIILGLILAVIHFFSDKVFLVRKVYQKRVISFSAGIFISYLFLHILPVFFNENTPTLRLSLISVLAGFSFFHLLENLAYRYHKGKEELKRRLKEVHSLGFFLYHFMVGIVLTTLLLQSLSGILFFLSLMLITATSSVSLGNIHGRVRSNKGLKLLLSLSTLLGMVAASALTLSPLHRVMLLGFVMGALLFAMVVDALPREREAQPLFFILGIALYSFFIGITWIL